MLRRALVAGVRRTRAYRAGKYAAFDDADSVVIDADAPRRVPDELEDDFERFNLKRGVTGVFDVEDLVDALRKENALDVFVCAVPAECAFVDHMCVVSGRSYRHMLAIAEFVKKLYKRKAAFTDRSTKIEGKESRDWIALDLGNIALHVFSSSARRTYDLEQLWSVGREFDAECHKQKSEILHVLETHSIELSDLKPADDNEHSDDQSKTDNENFNENELKK